MFELVKETAVTINKSLMKIFLSNKKTYLPYDRGDWVVYAGSRDPMVSGVKCKVIETAPARVLLLTNVRKRDYVFECSVNEVEPVVSLYSNNK